jgi:hypothetical protein
VTRLVVAKAWLGAAGVLVCAIGMAIGQRWLVWGAVGLLGPALLLRFVERRTPDE